MFFFCLVLLPPDVYWPTKVLNSVAIRLRIGTAVLSAATGDVNQ